MDFCGFLLCPSYTILESTETTFQTQEVSRNKEYTILTQIRQGLSYGTIQPHPTPAKQAMWKIQRNPDQSYPELAYPYWLFQGHVAQFLS